MCVIIQITALATGKKEGFVIKKVNLIKIEQLFAVAISYRVVRTLIIGLLVWFEGDAGQEAAYWGWISVRNTRSIREERSLKSERLCGVM